MTSLLIKTLPEAGRAVLERTHAALAAATDTRISELQRRVPRFRGRAPFRLVVTGEYNAGKSTILKALTGADIEIHSNVTTNEVREYPWGEVLLVDTPGVRAGLQEHDERAEQALRDADLVVFVITVDLFDDETADHLRHVAWDLGKLDQMIVVINKAAVRSAAPGVREAAVADVLRGAVTPPVVECDAGSSLTAQSTTDTERARFLEKVGNLSGLVDALNDLVKASGKIGQLRLPFQAALEAVRDATPYLEPGEEERAMANLVERRRQSIADSRIRLRSRLEQAYGATVDRILAAGEGLIATAAEDGAVPQEAIDRFQMKAEEVAHALQGKVETAFRDESADLEAEERGLAAGPEATLLAEAFSTVGVDPEGVPLSRGQGSVFLTSSYGKQVTELLKDKGKDWLDDAVLGGGKSGSPLHKLVLEFGHRLGHKFKPWEAVKWAKRLNFAINAGLVLFEYHNQIRAAQREEKALHAQQLELRSSVRDLAEGLVEAAKEQVAPIIDQFYGQASEPLSQLEETLTATARERAYLTEEFNAIRTESLRALNQADDPARLP